MRPSAGALCPSKSFAEEDMTNLDQAKAFRAAAKWMYRQPVYRNIGCCHALSRSWICRIVFEDFFGPTKDERYEEGTAGLGYWWRMREKGYSREVRVTALLLMAEIVEDEG